MKMSVSCIFESGDEVYYELRLHPAEECCVKVKQNGTAYVMQCENGETVYSWIAGPDVPLRNLTSEEEKKVLAFVDRLIKEKGSTR